MSLGIQVMIEELQGERAPCNYKDKIVSGSEGGCLYLTGMRNGVQENVGFLLTEKGW